MNNIFFSNTFRFIGLVFLQILIFNNINLFGYLNPYPYIAFVFLFPFKKERSVLLIFSFLIGLTIDFFTDSGGIHAASTLFIAYFRLYFVQLILRKSEFEYYTFQITSISVDKVLAYFFILILIHHFLIFSLEFFDIQSFFEILKRTLLSTIFTFLVTTFGYYILVSKNK
ncbi:MAG TPA: rod shape-determining protein MreD [Flavobacteriaceae bacterium]|nr:rod shape-determining protein MreD [Flavobacteriaceae bacterium]HEX5742315.1 rod shape-determining protein MreD [Flavobacteriaceae bacterium]